MNNVAQLEPVVLGIGPPPRHFSAEESAAWDGIVARVPGKLIWRDRLYLELTARTLAQYRIRAADCGLTEAVRNMLSKCFVQPDDIDLLLDQGK